MKAKTVALAGAIALFAGAAVAQTSTPQPDQPRPAPGQVTPPPPPPGPRPGVPEMRGPFHGPVPHMAGVPPLGKGSFLRVDRDGAVTLKCADEESTKDCVDAASPLIEKMRQGVQR